VDQALLQPDRRFHSLHQRRCKLRRQVETAVSANGAEETQAVPNVRVTTGNGETVNDVVADDEHPFTSV